MPLPKIDIFILITSNTARFSPWVKGRHLLIIIRWYYSCVIRARVLNMVFKFNLMTRTFLVRPISGSMMTVQSKNFYIRGRLVKQKHAACTRPCNVFS